MLNSFVDFKKGQLFRQNMSLLLQLQLCVSPTSLFLKYICKLAEKVVTNDTVLLNEKFESFSI